MLSFMEGCAKHRLVKGGGTFDVQDRNLEPIDYFGFRVFHTRAERSVQRDGMPLEIRCNSKRRKEETRFSARLREPQVRGRRAAPMDRGELRARRPASV